MTERMIEPAPKVITVERLLAPSLRRQATEQMNTDFAAYMHDERLRRRARRWQRRQDRANAIAWRALRGVEPGDAEYVACPEGRTRIRLAEDEMGDILFPRDLHSGWYEPMRWWKALHWLGWWRTRRTGQLVMVESEG